MRAFSLLFSSFLFFGFLFCNEPPALNDDFIRACGEFSIITEYTNYSTKNFWNKNGNKRSAFNRLNQNRVDVFAEYGVTSRHTFGIYGNYAQNGEELNGTTRGFGDAELCWKYWIGCLKSFQISSRVIAIIPTGKEKTTLRYARFGVELDLHGQKEFTIGNYWGWVEFLGGYRFYSGFPSDQIRFKAAAGIQLLSHLKIVGRLFLDYGLFNGHKNYNGPVLTLAPRYRLFKAELYGVIHVARFMHLYAGGFQHIWGENIGTGGGFLGGIWFDF